MTEAPQLFGPQGTLVGVLTRPERPSHDEVAFLLFNAGVIPRLGPHRINVKLARALAASGAPVLRFDLSGHGDSPPSAQSGGHDSGVHDLKAAMDHLEATLGIRRFALVGVCSGAVNAYRASLDDERVVGLLMFDGYWYRSRWTRWVRDYKHFRALAPVPAVKAVLRSLRARWRAGPPAEPAPTMFPENANPPHAEFCQGMQRLVARGATVRVVYSGSVIDYYSYGAQWRHVFGGEPWYDRVRCDFMPELDHSFVEIEGQRRFIDAVLAWRPAVLSAAAAR